MTGSPAQPRRQHLIQIAHDLFNRFGFHQVGIDLILRESGVSKATLYKYFPSKDDLALEALKMRSARFLDGMTQELAELRTRNPLANSSASVGVIVDFLARWIEGDAFFGCNFLRAADEYGEADHPMAVEARAHKQALMALIAAQLDEYAPERRLSLAAEILLILDGAIGVALVRSFAAPVATARRLIALVLADADKKHGSGSLA